MFLLICLFLIPPSLPPSLPSFSTVIYLLPLQLKKPDHRLPLRRRRIHGLLD